MKIVKTANWKDKISGGLADKRKPEDYCKEQLEKGMKIELEHTNDLEKAKEIAMDHLEEFEDFADCKGCNYYDALEEMENQCKKRKESMKILQTQKFARKKRKKKNDYNPYAICTQSVGEKEGTTERSKWDEDAKERYDSCIEKVEKKESQVSPRYRVQEQDNGLFLLIDSQKNEIVNQSQNEQEMVNLANLMNSEM